MSLYRQSSSSVQLKNVNAIIHTRPTIDTFTEINYGEVHILIKIVFMYKIKQKVKRRKV
jgi:hypothetical protein